MSRIDKVVPGVGSFRAPLNADIAATEVGKAKAVSVNTSGRVVIGGAANADLCGVIIANEAMSAGDQIDVFRLAEFVEFTTTAGVASTPGAIYYGATTGDITTTNTGKALGRTVEAGRFILHLPTMA